MKNKSNKPTETKTDKAAATPATDKPASATAATPADKKKTAKVPTIKPMKERHVARWNALTRRALAHVTPKAIGAILANGGTPRLVLDGGKVKVEMVEAPAS